MLQAGEHPLSPDLSVAPPPLAGPAPGIPVPRATSVPMPIIAAASPHHSSQVILHGVSSAEASCDVKLNGADGKYMESATLGRNHVSPASPATASQRPYSMFEFAQNAGNIIPPGCTARPPSLLLPDQSPEHGTSISPISIPKSPLLHSCIPESPTINGSSPYSHHNNTSLSSAFPRLSDNHISPGSNYVTPGYNHVTSGSNFVTLGSNHVTPGSNLVTPGSPLLTPAPLCSSASQVYVVFYLISNLFPPVKHIYGSHARSKI